MMEGLVKYASDEELSQNNTDEVKQSTTLTTLANLESEWENFEKMLAGDTDVSEDNHTAAVTSPTEAAPAIDDTDNTKPSAPVYNPYAYLSQYSTTSATSKDAAAAAADMEKQLEEFLERTAQAASSELSKEGEGAADNPDDSDDSHTDQSGSESDHPSNESAHSRSNSPSHSDDKAPHTEDKSPKEKKLQSPSKDGIDVIKKLDEKNKPSTSSTTTDKSSRDRRTHSPTRRSRSRRSHSRSRRSRSRSRRHHRRRRSSSRTRHGGSRRRRRSGSRHRRKIHRSRSPRHRHEGSRHRSNRHKRTRRRSRSRSKDIKRTTRKAMYGNPPQAKPPAQEDFKTKMKRELQQAAKDAIAGKGQATPQQALLQTMAAMHAKAQELTGVEIPKFYNPAAINPLKFAEQQQKRKLLWSKAAQNKEQSLQKFQGTEVVADEKYRKLMGIKGEVQLGEQSNEQKQKQDELFAKLDQEYAMARLTTHTHRGMGLGIVSSFAAASANEQMNKP